jgi:hypothetical protein
MIEFFQRYFDADGWMSADKLAPIVAEVIVGFSCTVPFFDKSPNFSCLSRSSLCGISSFVQTRQAQERQPNTPLKAFGP